MAITTSNPDADSWVRDNAPEFGILFVPEDSAFLNSFSLHVDDNYKAEEVAAYIRNMGSTDADDLTAFDAAPASATGGTETEE